MQFSDWVGHCDEFSEDLSSYYSTQVKVYTSIMAELCKPWPTAHAYTCSYALALIITDCRTQTSAAVNCFVYSVRERVVSYIEHWITCYYIIWLLAIFVAWAMRFSSGLTFHLLSIMTLFHDQSVKVSLCGTYNISYTSQVEAIIYTKLSVYIISVTQMDFNLLAISSYSLHIALVRWQVKPKFSWQSS